MSLVMSNEVRAYLGDANAKHLDTVPVNEVQCYACGEVMYPKTESVAVCLVAPDAGPVITLWSHRRCGSSRVFTAREWNDLQRHPPRALTVDPTGQGVYVDGRNQGDVQKYLEALERALAFECPRCHMISHHPAHVEQGYCGNCNDWTRSPTT